jgi:hypothetical protein
VHLKSVLQAVRLLDPTGEIGAAAGHGVGYELSVVDGQKVLAGHGLHADSPTEIN